MEKSKRIYDQNQLRDYASIFLRSNVNDYLKGDSSALEFKIDRYDKNWRSKQNVSYLDYLKYVYSILSIHYQNEYFYKNNFLNKWLIDELGKSNTKIFSEFRVGDSIADLAMFNGVSKVFEIKSDLDNDARLEAQIENYRKVFNEVYLVVPYAKLEDYLKVDLSIGIIVYNEGLNDFEFIRKATFNQYICTHTIMHLLHTNEYLGIVKEFYGELPEMTSFTMFAKCQQLLCNIPYEVLNSLFIKYIKRRNVNNYLSTRYYKELNQVFLSLNLDKNKKRILLDNLRSPILNS